MSFWLPSGSARQEQCPQILAKTPHCPKGQVVQNAPSGCHALEPTSWTQCVSSSNSHVMVLFFLLCASNAGTPGRCPSGMRPDTPKCTQQSFTLTWILFVTVDLVARGATVELHGTGLQDRNVDFDIIQLLHNVLLQAWCHWWLLKAQCHGCVMQCRANCQANTPCMYVMPQTTTCICHIHPTRKHAMHNADIK